MQLLREDDFLAAFEDVRVLLERLDVVVQRVAPHIGHFAGHVHRDRRLVLGDAERLRHLVADPGGGGEGGRRVEQPLAHDAAQPDRLHPVPLLPGAPALALLLVPEADPPQHPFGHQRVLRDVGHPVAGPVLADPGDAPVPADPGDLQGVRVRVLLDRVDLDDPNLQCAHSTVLPMARQPIAPKRPGPAFPTTFGVRRLRGTLSNIARYIE